MCHFARKSGPQTLHDPTGHSYRPYKKRCKREKHVIAPQVRLTFNISGY